MFHTPLFRKVVTRSPGKSNTVQTCRQSENAGETTLSRLTNTVQVSANRTPLTYPVAMVLIPSSTYLIPKAGFSQSEKNLREQLKRVLSERPATICTCTAQTTFGKWLQLRRTQSYSLPISLSHRVTINISRKCNQP